MATPAPGATYFGPQCPWCSATLEAEEIRSGALTCTRCDRRFEATAFTPPEKRLRVVEVAVAGPEGANACANHARNAAVSSCERCGLFICALCEMNVGDGTFCPTCFQRGRDEGTMHGAAGRIRDYSTLARLTGFLGLLMITFFGIPLGALSMWYAGKAIKQRREYGDSAASMIALMVLGAFEVLGSLAFIALMIIGITTK